MGGEQHFAVVSVQIHTWQQVQLGVHPVETPVRQIWQDADEKRAKPRGRRRKEEEAEGEKRKKKVIQQRTEQGEGYMNEMAQ